MTDGNAESVEKLVDPMNAVALLNSVGKNKSSMILPVYLAHSDSPGRKRPVYALLDTQSDTTFLLQSIADALDLFGTWVNLSLSTMLAENKCVKSNKIVKNQYWTPLFHCLH